MWVRMVRQDLDPPQGYRGRCAGMGVIPFLTGSLRMLRMLPSWVGSYRSSFSTLVFEVVQPKVEASSDGTQPTAKLVLMTFHPLPFETFLDHGAHVATGPRDKPIPFRPYDDQVSFKELNILEPLDRGKSTEVVATQRASLTDWR